MITLPLVMEGRTVQETRVRRKVAANVQPGVILKVQKIHTSYRQGVKGIFSLIIEKRMRKPPAVLTCLTLLLLCALCSVAPPGWVFCATVFELKFKF